MPNRRPTQKNGKSSPPRQKSTALLSRRHALAVGGIFTAGLGLGYGAQQFKRYLETTQSAGIRAGATTPAYASAQAPKIHHKEIIHHNIPFGRPLTHKEAQQLQHMENQASEAMDAFPSILSPPQEVQTLQAPPKNIAQPNMPALAPKTTAQLPKRITTAAHTPLFQGPVAPFSANKPLESSKAAPQQQNIPVEPTTPVQQAQQLPKKKPAPPAHSDVAAPHFQAGAGRVAIIIDDLGLNIRHTKEIIALPKILNTSFLPYGTHLAGLTRTAMRQNHTVMAHIPMEPMSRTVDPGPGALRTSQTDDELKLRLKMAIEAVPGALAINNHMGSRLTSNQRAMAAVMQQVAAQNIPFVDSRTTSRSVCKKLAGLLHIPFAERHIFIDHESSPDFIHRQLRKVETLAHRNGLVIAIGHPRPTTIAALQAWLPQTSHKNLTLVPITDLLRIG